jgi:hypothetical protein
VVKEEKDILVLKEIRRMSDITLISVLSGIGASILLAFVIVLTLDENKVSYYTTGKPLFYLLLLLTCLQIGQIVFSWIIISYWDQAPKQTDSVPLVN